jgi:hypothetical protein
MIILCENEVDRFCVLLKLKKTHKLVDNIESFNIAPHVHFTNKDFQTITKSSFILKNKGEVVLKAVDFI